MKFDTALKTIGAALILSCGFFHTLGYAAPGDVATDLVLWLDANDIDGDSDPLNNPADGDPISTWVDKSGAGNDAVAVGNPATFRSSDSELVNGNSIVRFNRTGTNQALAADGSPFSVPLDLKPGTAPQITVFSVYKPKSGFDRQGLWGNDNGSWDRFFYTYYSNFGDGIDDAIVGGISGGVLVEDAGKVDELYLLTTLYDSGVTNGSSVLFDGELVQTFTETANATDATSTFGIGWDGDGGTYDGQLAEVIVYNRLLDDCEIFQVNTYLGNKYGKDFTGFTGSYTGFDYPGEVGAIGLSSNPCSVDQRDSGVSGELLVDAPSDNTNNEEFFSFGHNGGLTAATTTDVPAALTHRLGRAWLASRTAGYAGSVDLTFDVAATGITDAADSSFYLLIGNDGSDYSAAAVSSIPTVYSNGSFKFSGVTLQDGEYFTLGINDLDLDDDGLSNSDEGTGDADEDGIPNYLDTDSDGNGIPDGMDGETITVGNRFLVTPEDSTISLGIGIDSAYTAGGSQLDIIGTEAGFRDAAAGTATSNFTIPAGATFVRITGMGGSDNGASSSTQEDYQRTSIVVDLLGSTYSGHTTYIITANDGNDNYTFTDVALGAPSDSGAVVGDNDDSANALTVSVTGASLSISETQSVVDQGYLVEYLTSDSTSSEYLGVSSAFMDVGVQTETLSLPLNTDFSVLSAAWAVAAGASSAHEDKGIGHFMIDAQTMIASGVLFTHSGRSDALTSAYAFTNYDLASNLPILSSGASIVGDTSGDGVSLPNPILSLAGNVFTVTRQASMAVPYVALFSANSFQRIAVGSGSLSLGSSSASGPYSWNASVTDTWDLAIPVGAETATGTLAMYNPSGDSSTGENSGFASFSVDLINETTSGSFVVMRASSPDLVSWENVPYGTRLVDHPGTVSNRAGIANYLDYVSAVFNFSTVTASDGSKTLRASALPETTGTKDWGRYDVVLQAQWIGNLPIEMRVDSDAGLLSAGGPDPVTGEWVVESDDIVGLSFTPTTHFSGDQTELTIEFDGQIDIIEIDVTRVADVPTVATTNQTGTQRVAFDISSSFTTTLVDQDGSETLVTELTVPALNTISDGTNTFASTAGSDVVDVSGWDLSSLTYISNDVGTFTLGVRAITTDDDGFSATTDTAEALDTIDIIILLDSDGDGIADVTDLDDDNDGIPDPTEGVGDSDTDGIPDYLDTDSDGDGVSDAIEGNVDTDADGIPDYLDLDSDGDGIPDSMDGETITVDNRFLATPEDTAIPLGIGIDPELTAGGSQLDNIGTEIGFRDASAGSAQNVFTIPTGTTFIKITGMGAGRNGTTSSLDEDLQQSSILVDLESGTYSGHTAYIVDQNTGNDNYVFSDVALGDASYSGTVVGDNADSANEITVSVAGTILLLSETQAVMEQAYLVEYLTSEGTSSDYLGVSSMVMDLGTQADTLTLPVGADFSVVSAIWASEVSGNSWHEDKGVAHIVVDLETMMANGVLFNHVNALEDGTSTYAFSNYDLTSNLPILSSTATVIGDVTASANSLPNPTLTLVGNALTISRQTDMSDMYSALISLNSFERQNVGSSAASLGASAATGTYSAEGGVLDTFDLAVPFGAETGTATLMMYNPAGSINRNENLGMATFSIDVKNQTTSGSFVTQRASTPDLLSWKEVPFGMRLFDHPNTVSNRATEISFIDDFSALIQFDVVAGADGGDILQASALGIATVAPADHLRYDVVMQAQWVGRFPIEMRVDSDAGLLSAGGPDPVTGEWVVGSDNIAGLSFTPATHFSGDQTELTIEFAGQIDIIEIDVTRVADAPTVTTTNQAGTQRIASDISNSFTTALVDQDGSETLVTELIVPATHTISDGANTFTGSAGSQLVDVSGWDLSSLTYLSDDVGTFTVGVRATTTDDDGFSATTDSAEILNSFDVILALDTDADGIVDSVDVDDDNDGLSDVFEGGGDSDGDGIPNSIDGDDYGFYDFDGDGISNDAESCYASIPDLIEITVGGETPRAVLKDGARQATVDFLREGGNVGLSSVVGQTAFKISEHTNFDGVYTFVLSQPLFDIDILIDNFVPDSEFGNFTVGLEDGTVITNADFSIYQDVIGTSASLGLFGPLNSSSEVLGLKDSSSGFHRIVGPSSTAGGEQYAARIRLADSSVAHDGNGITSVSFEKINGASSNWSGSVSLSARFVDGPDTDGDGLLDCVDPDSDADGIPDATEGDIDTDGNSIPDYQDTDSDGDGIADSVETAVDTDGDGIPDNIDPDSDNDGINDSVEGSADSDGDGVADYLDGDSDGDGINDNAEGTLDTDNDGLANFIDTDSDGDNIADSIEGVVDTDNDGVVDYLDTDSDDDGIDDSIEGVIDSDGDGAFDYVDQDADGDGVPDSVEGLGDTDGDGIPHYLDTDSDNDGIPDAEETNVDTDGDGIPNSIDPDVNNDGIPDIDLGTNDTDGDGIADYLDDDIDGDGLANASEGAPNTTDDSDGDGIPNYADTDSDNDGLLDALEGNGDKDGDGIPDFLDTDSDGDSISDVLEGSVDSDADGVADYLDTDSDNDGVLDVTEGSVDSDGDGIADYLDTDSDGDGIGDSLEGWLDSDNDGLADYIDTDSDADGIDDSVEGAVDTDNDGVLNYLDTDSDGDGIDDIVEGVIDSDGDGAPDYVDQDADGDGVPDSVEGLGDTDGDGIPHYLDTDSDNDGIPDAQETNTDTDGDGIPNLLDPDVNNDGIPDSDLSTGDTDGDGIADYLDDDIDGDGIANTSEGAPNPTDDSDGDGIPNYADIDSDNDGLLDALEGVGDLDGDGVPNFLDSDSDGDGISDSAEGLLDTDGDGIADYLDADSDNDGINDSVEGSLDTDNDGVADYLDDDSDGDGIGDAAEGTVDTDNDGLADYIDMDSDNDGIDDSIEGVVDTDNDGVLDYLDTDSDGDGIDDSIEGAIDSDGDGAFDHVDQDADGDGVPDSVEGLGDTDGDGIPHYLDTDSDNDGIPDAEETNTDTDGDGIPNSIDPDVNNDGIPDSDLGTGDIDSDGIPDYLDDDIDGDGLANASEGAPNPTDDSDGDGVPNYADTDSDNDGLLDALEGSGDQNGDGVPNFLDTDSDGDDIADALEGFIDSDDDGIADYLDTDSDNDGVPDLTEGSSDADGDGTADYLDSDSDGDGINDAIEGSTDSDGDGIANYLDTDSDGDGISDTLEGSTDSDGDGIPDYLDSDSDNDGLLDALEGTIDSDADGIPDYLDTDSDGDGISDALEGSSDSDSDGIPDYLDTDSDNDGHGDTIEGFVDSDGDGVVDYLDTDSDNDGIVDALEASTDTDADGIVDRIDLDSDGDGISDALEGLLDSDDDGAADYLDTDSDNDSIPDIVEGALDSDGDGMPDYLDTDSDNDGIPDSEEGTMDSDGDGISDALDTDSNGDGIDDAVAGTADTDGDGIADYLDADIDGDGIANGSEGSLNPAADTDGDGIPNYADTDSDNDGIDDRVEGAGDGDGDGIADAYDTDSDGDGIADIAEGTVDSDDDGIPDYLDTDSDNDGVSDALESSSDTDGDGIPNYLDTDSDNDGISDATEGSVDTDGDGAADYVDIDSDGDGISDTAEGVSDTDGDGVPNYLDTDSDGDGIPDVTEGSVDSDGDGIPDSQDTDANGDGIPDDALGNGDTDGDGIPDYLDGDIDGDGIPNGSEGSLNPAEDSDGDGIPNYADSDSDNDGIPDSLEGTGDSDGDGILDAFDSDSDNDGVPDGEEGSLDSDNDGIPDYLDPDSDNDGIPDAIEGSTDTDGDGIPDYLDSDGNNDGIPDALLGSGDTDGDGIPDYLDNDIDGDGISNADEATGGLDSDGDGIPDYRDVDSNNDGVSDALSGSADTDGDGIADYLDNDIDGDGISNAQETALGSDTDSDGDGVLNFLDLDADNDGLPDSVEGGVDSDGDGNPDELDLDSDNDGLPDLLEAGGDDIDSNGTVDNFRDTDGNGLDEGLEAFALPMTNNDGDPLADYLDLDSDNDGLPDTLESGSASLDANGDGRIDEGLLDDGDGWSDAVPFSVFIDTDGDGVANHLDLDADNDGIYDLVEAGGEDVDNDGMIDGWADADGDGIPDSIDADHQSASDSDGDGIADFADADFLDEPDSDGDGIVDRFDINPYNDGFARASTGEPLFAAALPDADGDGQPDVLEAIGDQGTVHTGLRGSGSMGPLSLVLLGVPGVLLARRRRRVPPRRSTILAALGSHKPSEKPLLRQVARRSLVGAAVLAAVAVSASASTDVLTPAQSTQGQGGSEQARVPQSRLARHVYVAAGVGVSDLNPYTGDMGNLDVSDSASVGSQFTLGLDISRQLSVELHTADLGSAQFAPAGGMNYQVSGASALIYMGKNRDNYKRFGLTGYARLGVGVLKNRSEGGVAFTQDNSNHFLLGAGLEYMSKRSVGVRAEVISHDKDVRYAQLAIIYRFGHQHSALPIVPMAVAIAKPIQPILLPKTPLADCSWQSELLSDFHFKTDSLVMSNQGEVLLAKLGEQLVACKDVSVKLAGHTDNTGSSLYNQTLSTRRVIEIAQRLHQLGVDISRMTSRSFGESQPKFANISAENRRLNRRVEVRVE